jgi:uncharacterized protein YjdB
MTMLKNLHTERKEVMKRFSKKILALVLTMMMVIGTINMTAYAAEEPENTAAPQIVNFNVTNEEHSDEDAEINQIIKVTITFDEAIKVGENAIDDLDIKIAGGDAKQTARNINIAANTDNDKELIITMTSTGWVAVMNGILNIDESEKGIQNITSVDGTPVLWTNLETYIPIGIALDTNQTVGTETTPASTTVNVTHKANMRGMYHVQILSNGESIIENDSYYASSITSHAHLFYTTITKEAIAQAIATQINAATSDYIATYEEGSTNLTVTAKNPKDGEIITVQMLEYNEDGRYVDPLLKKAAAEATAKLTSNDVTYTEESKAAVESAIKDVEALIGTNPSLKDQADAKAALKTALAALKEKDSEEEKDPEAPTTAAPVTDVKVTKITLSGISKKIAAGKTITLTAAISPANATNKAVTWTSSNTKYATVKNGKVTIKSAGAGKTVTIKATAKDSSKITASYKITIMKHAVKSIKLKASKSVKAGKKTTVKATVKTTGKKANKTLKWTSSNVKYATVSSKGVVKTTKKGKGKTVTITAMATDGSGKKAAKKIKIK